MDELSYTATVSILFRERVEVSSVPALVGSIPNGVELVDTETLGPANPFSL